MTTSQRIEAMKAKIEVEKQDRLNRDKANMQRPEVVAMLKTMGIVQ